MTEHVAPWPPIHPDAAMVLVPPRRGFIGENPSADILRKEGPFQMR
ncbi:hypothetical protein [Tardiphaga robiniae]|nr:hypothetical protein [Tardiphaga robiniae]